jgi:hypothetical protein
MSVDEANNFVNEVLKDGYHAVQVHTLKNTFSESGDPAYVQNQYIFIEYEEEDAPKVGRPKKSEQTDG